jgi:hypothetical protein
MKPSEIKYSEEATPSDKTTLKELLSREQDLESFLLEWVRKQERGLTLTQGFDDDGEASQICAILSIYCAYGAKQRDIAELYYHRTEVRKAFASVPEIASFVRGYDSNEACLVIREKELVKWQKTLGFAFHQNLATPCGGYLAAIPYMMSYCLSIGGTACLSPYEKDIYEYASLDPYGEAKLPELASLRVFNASYECPNPALLGPGKPFGIPLFEDYACIDLAKASHRAPKPRFKLERRILRASQKRIVVPTAHVGDEIVH